MNMVLLDGTSSKVSIRLCGVPSTSDQLITLPLDLSTSKTVGSVPFLEDLIHL